MYHAKVNGSRSFKIQMEDGELKIDGELVALDSRVLSPSSSHVLYKNRSYNIEIISEDKQEKVLLIKVNGNVYQVAVKDQFDQLLKQLGMDNLSSNKVKEVKAPMPGLVLDIIVAAGQEIKKGDNLVVLEAMKMENILKSPTDGMISKILINKGDKVEKNQILLQFS